MHIHAFCNSPFVLRTPLRRVIEQGVENLYH